MDTTTTTETMPEPGDVLDCGHVCPPRDGLGTGYARQRDTGRTMCYQCADDAQRAELLTSDRMSAYLHRDNPHTLTVTTWTGGKLGTVTWSNVTTGYTPTGGEFERHAVRVTDVHGQHWHGTGPGEGMYVSLRRSK